MVVNGLKHRRIHHKVHIAMMHCQDQILKNIIIVAVLICCLLDQFDV